MIRRCAAAAIAGALLLAGAAVVPATSKGSVSTPAPAAAEHTQTGERSGGSLESAAKRAGVTGRAVAMSLIGLALAIAAMVLAFRRDFKEAAGVLAVGIVAILLATPAGLNVLRDTVSSLFGS